MMTIDQKKLTCVVGLGYIGLPTATILANAGHQVIGVDVNLDSVKAINESRVPFVEANLEEALMQAVQSSRLVAQDEMPVAGTYIVAVPTPFKDGKTADLSYIESAAAQIAPQLSGSELIILESTSPPKTTEKLAHWILELRPDLNLSLGDEKTVYFAHCPERVLPGKIMEELVKNDRIIGGLNLDAAEQARDLYATFCEGKLLLTDAATAEMAKLVENSYRDVNIAFANELSLLADELGIDVWELIELANHHPRVNILQPGPGVGGHCIAVDPWFIVDALPDQARLIRTAREVNDQKPFSVILKTQNAAKLFENPKIATLGLAFKSDIDDLRESPSRKITEELARSLTDAQFFVVEPNIDVLPPELEALENVQFMEYREAIKQANIVLLLVDHKQFHEIHADDLSGKAVIDTRGLWRERE